MTPGARRKIYTKQYLSVVPRESENRWVRLDKPSPPDTFRAGKRTTCQVRACVFATGFRIDCICPALYLRRRGCGKPDPRHTCLFCRTGKGSKDHSTANSDRLRVEGWKDIPHQNLWVKPWSTILTTNGGKGRFLRDPPCILEKGQLWYGPSPSLSQRKHPNLITQCKNRVTIISALTTAFLAARQEVLAPLPEEKNFHRHPI